MSLGIHHAHLSLWVGLSLSAWLSNHAIILLVCIRLSLPNLIVRSLVHCICDQPINSMGIPLFFLFTRAEHITTHVIQIIFVSIARTIGNRHMS